MTLRVQNTAADSSGNSRNGVVYPGTASSFGAAPFVVADSAAASFDAGHQNSAVSLGTQAAISGTGAYSIEAWVTPRSIAQDGLDAFYVQDDGKGAAGAETGLFFDPLQKIRFEVSTPPPIHSPFLATLFCRPVGHIRWSPPDRRPDNRQDLHQRALDITATVTAVT